MIFIHVFIRNKQTFHSIWVEIKQREKLNQNFIIKKKLIGMKKVKENDWWLLDVICFSQRTTWNATTILFYLRVV